MSNLEIVSTEAAMRGIAEEVYTFQVWKSKGYSVKKGEKARFQTKIWKQVTDKETKEKKMIMVTGSFFTFQQVEKTTK